MLLWVVIALLTAVGVLAVLVPLSRQPARIGAAAREAGVYRLQLTELERDTADGRIGAAEAAAARAEIARRLIAVDAAPVTNASASPRPARIVAVAALVGIPILSLTLYGILGAPEMPSMPLAARINDRGGDGDLALMVAKVEAHLASEPEDGTGWDVIAPVYRQIGRVADAVAAYRNAIRIGGSSAVRQNGLGEALFAAADGIVTADARGAFEAAQALDPSAPSPRFFLGLAAEQDGRTADAAATWRALLAEAPADADWRVPVREALARVDPGAASAPSAAEVIAASPDEQQAMIGGMVARLAARLDSEPDDVEGWLRLIRSYVTLGRTDDAAAASRAALAGAPDDAGRQKIQALMTELGVAPGKATP